MTVISASAPLLTRVTTGPEYQREILKIAAMMSNVSNTSDEIPSSKNPSQLSELATKKLISRLTPCDCSWTTDVIEASNFIKNFSYPKNVFNTLTKETLKQLKFDNNPKIVLMSHQPGLKTVNPAPSLDRSTGYQLLIKPSKNLRCSL